MRSRNQSQKNRKRRHGAALVGALVCLLIISIITAALLRLVYQSHRQTRVKQHELQALWLAEAGVDRAAARLQQAADYQGETWQLNDLPSSGAVEIRIETVAENDNQRRILVEARYPDDPIWRVVQRREQLFSMIPGDSL